MPDATAYLAAPLTLGAPDVHDGLAVYPVFGGAPRLAYRPLATAAPLGAQVRELDGGASVNDLLVDNPTDLPVLLYEGEKLVGAQQDRTLDVTVLVAARARATVPVSCVERGRWDGSRHREPFAPAPQAAHPGLRAAKRAQAAATAAAGGVARADQGAVWQHVDHDLEALRVAAPTRSLTDAFEDHRVALDELAAGSPRRDGQLGTLAAIGGRLVALDVVSRPDAFAALHGPLVRGYALDAVKAGSAPGARGAPSAADAQAWLDAVLRTPLQERDGIGLGRECRFDGPAARGAALIAEEELVQLCAFA